MNIKTYLNEQKWYVSNIIVLSIIVVSLSNPGLLNARVFESQALARTRGKQLIQLIVWRAWGQVVGRTHYWRRSKGPTKGWPWGIHFPLAEHPDFLLITDVSEHPCVSSFSARWLSSPPCTPSPWQRDFLLSQTPTGCVYMNVTQVQRGHVSGSLKRTRGFWWSAGRQERTEF